MESDIDINNNQPQHQNIPSTLITLTTKPSKIQSNLNNYERRLVGRVFANVPGDLGSILGRVIPKTLKMVLDTSLLNSFIRYVSRVKWSNPGKGVAPSPTLRCSSYWKGGLLVALDYRRQLHFFYLKNREYELHLPESHNYQEIFPFNEWMWYTTNSFLVILLWYVNSFKKSFFKMT